MCLGSVIVIKLVVNKLPPSSCQQQNISFRYQSFQKEKPRKYFPLYMKNYKINGFLARRAGFFFHWFQSMECCEGWWWWMMETCLQSNINNSIRKSWNKIEIKERVFKVFVKYQRTFREICVRLSVKGYRLTVIGYRRRKNEKNKHHNAA